MSNLQMVKGDTFVFDVAVTRPNPSTGVEEPVNLTGAKAWFSAKERSTDADNVAIIKYDTVTNPLNIAIQAPATAGIVRVTIAPGDTNTVVHRWFQYDVQVKESSGTISTVARGKLELLKQATITTA